MRSVSTISDWARGHAALQKGTVLKRETLERMWTPGRLNNGARNDDALGWFVGRYRGWRRVEHSGSMPGVHDEQWYFPEDGMSIIVLCNLDYARTSVIAERIADFYLPPARPVEDKEPKITDQPRTPPPANPKVHEPTGTASASANRTRSGFIASNRSGRSALPNVTIEPSGSTSKIRS